ncbi:MAG: sulfide/dihydroorotate dehydrogenase-like FAD/NAD-binding protein [Methanomicrobiaceae archaeon]|nr:sulfide/dihydroorotate dehydrogenase-like FAD/NAD-binding protein [Methanomicrobiaceae archaeon]
MAYKIEKAEEIAENIFELWIKAPHVARNAKAGQFLVIRINDKGERIPLTVSGVDGDLVRIVFMKVGKTTMFLSTLGVGDFIEDVAGPLGHPSEIKKWGRCVVIGGGVGIACLPILAKALRDSGNEVTGIIGARNESLILLKDELSSFCDEFVVCTDDGSCGYHGFPVDILKKKLEEGSVDCVWIIGPAIMMKITSLATIPYNVKTFVSLNPIMVDGTGMCGSCRVTIDGETKFACVDGPEFEASLVDWDELMTRQKVYTEEELKSRELFEDHTCECGGH